MMKTIPHANIYYTFYDKGNWGIKQFDQQIKMEAKFKMLHNIGKSIFVGTNDHIHYSFINGDSGKVFYIIAHKNLFKNKIDSEIYEEFIGNFRSELHKRFINPTRLPNEFVASYDFQKRILPDLIFSSNYVWGRKKIIDIDKNNLNEENLMQVISLKTARFNSLAKHAREAVRDF